MAVLEELTAEHGLLADKTLLQSSLFEALFDNNVVWKSKYNERVKLEHHDFNKYVVKQWLE